MSYVQTYAQFTAKAISNALIKDGKSPVFAANEQLFKQKTALSGASDVTPDEAVILLIGLRNQYPLLSAMIDEALNSAKSALELYQALERSLLNRKAHRAHIRMMNEALSVAKEPHSSLVLPSWHRRLFSSVEVDLIRGHLFRETPRIVITHGLSYQQGSFIMQLCQDLLITYAIIGGINNFSHRNHLKQVKFMKRMMAPPYDTAPYTQVNCNHRASSVSLEPMRNPPLIISDMPYIYDGIDQFLMGYLSTGAPFYLLITGIDPKNTDVYIGELQHLGFILLKEYKSLCLPIEDVGKETSLMFYHKGKLTEHIGGTPSNVCKYMVESVGSYTKLPPYRNVPLLSDVDSALYYIFNAFYR